MQVTTRTNDLLRLTPAGLYCEAGDFYIDPWRGVDRAIITHGHADHARFGSRSYLCSKTSEAILSVRLPGASIQTIPFGEPVVMNGVRVSLHPAGHILGSAQVRVEHHGEVWVVSGDYKTQPDNTCENFEVQRCHHFISECTFGLPIYHWRPQADVFAEINRWWSDNQQNGRTSILFAYSLGKAQRILGGIDPSIGPILLHGSIPKLNEAYASGGIKLPDCLYASPENAKATKGRALLVAPPSAAGTTWLRKFQPYSLAMASGWMQIRGTRRRRAMDRGFVLSDHADWSGLLDTIKATEAERVGLTHGYTSSLTRWLCESGIDAYSIETRFTGETGEEAEEAEPEE